MVDQGSLDTRPRCAKTWDTVHHQGGAPWPPWGRRRRRAVVSHGPCSAHRFLGSRAAWFTDGGLVHRTGPCPRDRPSLAPCRVGVRWSEERDRSATLNVCEGSPPLQGAEGEPAAGCRVLLRFRSIGEPPGRVSPGGSKSRVTESPRCFQSVADVQYRDDWANVSRSCAERA